MAAQTKNGSRTTPDALAVNAMVAENRRIELNLAHNVLTMRQEMFRKLFDPRRDIDDECGYPKEPTVDEYQRLYERDPIARRVVEVWPRECWLVTPLVYEDEDGDAETEFEVAWDRLAKDLRGEHSRYRDEAGSSVWDYLMRADIQAGIGSYGVILLGFDDGRSLDAPVKGVEEVYSIPAGKGDANPGYAGQRYSLNVNAAVTKGRKLMYLRVFPESQAVVNRWEMNPSSPRYGQPTQYQITFNDTRESGSLGVGGPLASRNVHWTRVIHVPSDGVGSNEVHGTPRMQPVLNAILDARKVRGAASEGYWKSCFTAFSFETHPQLGGDVDIDKPAMRDMIERFRNGLQRDFVTTGMNVNPLAPQVVDPTAIHDGAIEAICIEIQIPVPVFKGYEIGEQASTNNAEDWNNRRKGRQSMRCTPRLVIPFIDRLVMVGALPEPEGYSVEWPDVATQGATERADVALKQTQALAAYTAGGVDTVVQPMDYLTRILGLDDEAATAILANAAKALEGDGAEAGGSPLLGLVGGITGMIELFKLAQAGGLSEEQLKAQIMLFFKVSEDMADELIADGLTPAATEAGIGMEGQIDKGLAPDPIAESEAKVEAMKLKAKQPAVVGKPAFGGPPA